MRIVLKTSHGEHSVELEKYPNAEALEDYFGLTDLAIRESPDLTWLLLESISSRLEASGAGKYGQHIAKLAHERILMGLLDASSTDPVVVLED